MDDTKEDVFGILGNILNPNRCEICEFLSDTNKNYVCSITHDVVPDVSGQPNWCPKRLEE